MDIYDDFPGAFFKATELTGKRLPVTITCVEKQEMSDGRVKPVLRFEEDPRGLVLNVENRAALADRFGRDTKGWVGKKVTLITRSVQGPNGPCQGIRLADAPVGEQLNDEIPDNMQALPKRKRGFTK